MLRALLGRIFQRREVEPPPLAPPSALPGIPVVPIGAAIVPLPPPPPPPPPPPAPLLTAQLLQALGAADPAGWAPILAAACAAGEITTPRRVAYFVANVLHETGGLRRLAESLDYSAEGLARTWPSRFAEPGVKPLRPTDLACRLGRWKDSLGRVSPANQRGIAAVVYGGRMGNASAEDAWRFRGRGGLQLTGRDNWQRLAVACGRSLVELEAWLETREGAVASAAHYWRWCGANARADLGDLAGCRRLVNGGTIGLEAVEHLAELALAELRARAA